MENFISFLLKKVYKAKPIPSQIVSQAFEATIKDVKYHFPKMDTTEITQNIQTNSNELAIFLFRLGVELHLAEREDLKPQIHWLLKEMCGCEIYFNNVIEEGFYVVHGEGTVIGSRNKIGKGFLIHQGCTIGHKKNGTGKGNTIGDKVTMYCNASIIGELTIENNVTIGAHVMVTKNQLKNTIITNQEEYKIKMLRN